MKKITLIAAASLLLIGGAVAYAAGNSIVGKKVDKAVTLTVDGKELKTDAIIIDGVTYAPIRAVSDAYNSKVAYKKDRVDITTANVTDKKGEETLQNRTNANDVQNIEKDIKTKKGYIESNQARIKKNSESIEFNKKQYSELLVYKESGLKFEDTETYKYLNAENERMEKDNANLEKEIAELERQKAGLSANK